MSISESPARFQDSYQEEPLPAYHYLTSSRTGLERDEENGKQVLFDDEKEIKSSAVNSEHRIISTTELHPTLCRNHVDPQEPFPGSWISGSEEPKLFIACNRCRPATISRLADFEQENYRNTSVASNPCGTHQSSLQSHQKKIGAVLSRLCPRLRRKPKSKISPKRLEPEDKAEVVMDSDVCAVGRVTKELNGATENRDAALAEVGEMRSSFQELREKLTHLEAHCKELKTALKQALQGKHAKSTEKKHDVTKRTKSSGSSRDFSTPVSHEVMLEGFLQIAAEARLSVTQFCKTLIDRTEEADHIGSLEKLKAYAPPSNLTLMCRGSKGLQYHLESLVNQTLYQDFENCVFQRNGAQKILNPQEYCLENFSTFVALRSLSWKEILTKGSRGYSEDLSRFCDQKMSSVVSLLDWLGPWPEQLCQAFFVAAKCVWLLHLLAFSFSPPLVILRVEENRGFDPLYMEDVLSDRQRMQAQDHVKVMNNLIIEAIL
ncbi:hypothetical protein Taro_043059 [Colocasia esculenta]|uniref:IRK-interacting protein n=1 Tax=Colocasia esculenta TaxID=4460 RepID=A0A843WK12_COLES|nr:hypothetical protein [Colocasia esculenta]